MAMENVQAIGFDMVGFTDRDSSGFAATVILTRAELLTLLAALMPAHTIGERVQTLCAVARRDTL